MCLGVPGRVISVHGDVATVDFWGLPRAIRLDVVDQPVAPGDWILNHVGFAIRRIPDGEIEETLALYDTLLAAKDDGDFMARDVKSEIAASGSSAGDGVSREELGAICMPCAAKGAFRERR